MGAGCCLGPEENGVSLGEGVREGPLPRKKISSQCSARAETTWRRKKRNGQVGHDEEGPARTESAIFPRRRFIISVNCV